MHSNPIQSLAALLEGAEAKPRVVPSRLAPSAFYDIEYRIAVLAMVFESFATPFGPSARRIHVARFKLLQFVSSRPWLIPAVREWSAGTGQASFEFALSMRIRRGFLSDNAFDDVVQLLTAIEVFERRENHIISGANAGHIKKVTTLIRDTNIFVRERNAIAELTEIRITANMLEGW